MLAGLVAAYLAASLAVGLWAARRVRDAADYAVASRHFGAPVVAATVFATWFGAETVLGIPATFMDEGLRGLAADPFGAVGCLVLVGLAFARPLYRLDLLTLGDFFRRRFDARAEALLSLAIAASYVGWIAAQLVALGLAFDVLSGGAIDTRTGIVIGIAVVLAYTVTGGMWAVAATDFFQAVVIVLGMGWVAWTVADLAGGVAPVLAAAGEGGRMAVLPEPDARSVLAWISAALVVVLGSIPQQDVFQRVRSASSERAAVVGSVAGGALYLVVAAIPIFLAAAASVIDPAMVARVGARDHQLVLPTLILERTPLVVQVLFFGALVSAILSTAAGALLAPAVVVAENLVLPRLARVDDRRRLAAMRLSVVAIAAAVTAMALTSSLSIYQLVNESGKVVLVSSFVPLAAGLFWKRATARGALAAFVLGLAAWVGGEALAPGAVLPPPLAGLLASAAGMLAGSLLGPSRPR